MQTNKDFYIHKLKEVFSYKKRVNTNYSLRAFAKYLNIDSSNLSAILNKKRKLPIHRAEKIAEKLNLRPSEKHLFLFSVQKTKNKLDTIKPLAKIDTQYLLDDIFHSIIAEWEYYAFLNLIQTDDFQSDHKWISKRLQISIERVDVIIGNLLNNKFISIDDKRKYRRLIPRLQTSEDVVSQALQQSHHDSLMLAKQKLEEIDVALRDYSSMTLAINPERLPEAKIIIREFQDKLEALFENDRKKEVYLFSSQFYPITKKQGD